MFDEKKEDKGVADYGQCPHNHQENEAGKKNLKITNTSFHLVSMQGVFVFRGHSIAKIKVAKALKNKNAFFLGHPVQYTPIVEYRATLGRNPQKKSFCQLTMFHCLRMKRSGAGQDFSFKFSLSISGRIFVLFTFSK